MATVTNNTIINTVAFEGRRFFSMHLMSDYTTIFINYLNGEVEKVDGTKDFDYFNLLAERYFGFPPLSDCNW